METVVSAQWSDKEIYGQGEAAFTRATFDETAASSRWDSILPLYCGEMYEP
jgi:hypothetical protein